MRKILYFILLLITLSITSQTKKETQLYILNKLKMYVDQSDDYIISFSMDQSGFWFEYKPETKNLNTRKYSFPLWSIDKISLHSRNLTFYLNNYCSACLVEITGNQNYQIKSFTLGLKSANPEEDFLGRFQRAIDHLKTMYPKKPSSSDLFDKDRNKENPTKTKETIDKLYAEGYRLFKLNNFSESKKIFEQVLKLTPNDESVHYNLGMLSSQMKDISNAKYHYQQALKINPNHRNSNWDMAVLILEQDDNIYQKMIKLGNSALETEKYNQLEEERKKIYKQALPYIERLRKIDKNDLTILETLKVTYQILGMTRELIELKNK